MGVPSAYPCPPAWMTAALFRCAYNASSLPSYLDAHGVVPLRLQCQLPAILSGCPRRCPPVPVPVW
eukprot:1159889-Pelagomonas_calceolata.AAC.8